MAAVNNEVLLYSREKFSATTLAFQTWIVHHLLVEEPRSLLLKNLTITR
jgi:hypothetical protein